MRRIFERAGFSAPQKSAFDLSHERKLSCNMGELVPIYLEEVLPSDQFRVGSEVFMRFAPMLFPVMHRVDVYVHYFFVPNRLVWNMWEEFITGGQDGLSTPTFPKLNGNDGDCSEGSLADYMGIPPTVDNTGFDFNALPFRAYQLVYNEYYRDPNLDNELDITDNSVVLGLRTRRWEKDYFTSALPWSQRGNQPSIPMDFQYKDSSDFLKDTGATANSGATPSFGDGTAGDLGTMWDGTNEIRVENLDDIQSGIDVNELRRTQRIQRWLETAARGGYRYIEQLASRFGIQSSDARLQRPEYLGGGKQPVSISEVLNTTGTTERPQGDMAGHGVSMGRSNTFQRTFEEHGFVIGIMSVMPRTSYQQGVHRIWRKFDKFDFFWPEFANLGEQEVQNMEVFHSATDGLNTNVFGYQQRYAEYKYGVSRVHGAFRTDPLEDWHLGRIFASRPNLNSDFVSVDPTKLHRIFANTDSSDDKLWVQIFNSVKARRPMPYFADPRL